MNAEYSIAAAVAPVAVITFEVTAAHTGILRTARYWAAVVLILAFQIPVDGLLTTGASPVVTYRTTAMSGVRVGWNTPIEDFGFGYALVTLTLVLWVYRRKRERRDGT